MPILNELECLISLLESVVTPEELCSALTASESLDAAQVESRETLYMLLSAIQKVIDSARADSAVSDVSKSQALTTYTVLVVRFADLSSQIRPQFIKALEEMIFRRNPKRRDYVNSFLRGCACECLTELEHVFPGEVAEALELPDWLSTAPSSNQPSIIDVLQTESLPCVENYAKLLLTSCLRKKTQYTVHHKALIKIVSLLLDSVEHSSVWMRGFLATHLNDVVRLSRNEESESPWTLAVVQHHCGRLLNSMKTYQLHAFLIVSKQFVSEWDPHLIDRVVDRLYSISNAGNSISLPERQLAVLWLCDLLDDYFMRFSVYERRRLLVPQPSADPPELVEVKLQAILRFSVEFESIPRNVVRCVNLRANYLDVTFRFLRRLINSPFRTGSDLFGIPAFVCDHLQLENKRSSSVITLVQQTNNFNAQLILMQSLADFLKSIQPPSRVISHYFPLVAFLASQKALKAEHVLCALERYQPANPSWKEGLRFIEVCRLLIRSHDEHTTEKVIGLLKSVEWNSVDLRNRSETLIRFVSTLGPNFDRMHQVPAGSTSTADESVLTQGDHPLSCPTLRLEQNRELRKELGILDGGWSTFHQNILMLPFTLRLDQESSLTELFAIEFTFSASEAYEPFRSVTIPFLGKGSGEQFPNKYNLSLSLRPIHPIPVCFCVEALFTDRHGASHRAQLDDFCVSLEDLFLPVTDLVNIWNTKWRDPFAKLLSLPREKVLEVIQNRLGPFEVPDELAKELPEPPNEFDFDHELLLHELPINADSGLYREKVVMIHLPPNYHLMMRFQMGRATTLVWIDTDRKEILSLLDVFFQSWS